jgi:hypothetical protein
MPAVTPAPVSIKLTWGHVVSEGTKRIKAAMHGVILDALVQAINDTVHLAERIVPESRRGDYGPSYGKRSEQLLAKYLADLAKAKVKVLSGENVLRRQYTIQEKWRASYTSYVNVMKSSQFSKPSAKSGFVDLLHAFLKARVRFHLRRALAVANVKHSTAVSAGVTA